MQVVGAWLRHRSGIGGHNDQGMAFRAGTGSGGQQCQRTGRAISEQQRRQCPLWLG
jgi:hypothetical protein